MYRKKAHIHFVGIGGIGMSGIATVLRYQGYSISGCDRDLQQQSVKKLQEIGCIVQSGNNTPACNDKTIDVLVYSSAIKSNNPEIIAAQKRGIPTISRALMLAELMRTKYSIAIAGSHGKTTTTSLIAHLLIEAGLDPTVIIGGHLKNISTNARIGEGDFLVAEADESDRSLLHLHATLAVITNIDLEHLETYSDLNDVKNTFQLFLNNLPFYGKAIVCVDDPHIRSILPMPHLKTITYGIEYPAHISATNIQLHPDYSTFDLQIDTHLTPIRTTLLGQHNILNILGAIALARELGVSESKIAAAIKTFKGVERRFSYKGTFKGVEIFDDYGHHPKEIACTLSVAKRRAKKKLTILFQPHRFSRTQALWNDFIATFLASDIDRLIITDIYPASEEPIDEVTGKNLAIALQKHNPKFSIAYIPFDTEFKHIKKSLDPLLEDDDLLLLLGAGKMNKLVEYL